MRHSLRQQQQREFLLPTFISGVSFLGQIDFLDREAENNNLEQNRFLKYSYLYISMYMTNMNRK